MNLLRRMLYIQAAAKTLIGLGLALTPGIVISIFDLTGPPERAWMRILGINFLVLAMLAVLIARRIEDVWWWAWAYVLGNMATATFAVLKAAFGTGANSGVLYWWTLVAVNLFLAAGTAWGLARTGQERLPS